MPYRAPTLRGPVRLQSFRLLPRPDFISLIAFACTITFNIPAVAQDCRPDHSVARRGDAIALANGTELPDSVVDTAITFWQACPSYGRDFPVFSQGQDGFRTIHIRLDAGNRGSDRCRDDLRKIARRQLRRLRPGQTLQTTGLVHEAYIKLVDQEQASWEDRSHFFAIAACAMRQVLVDYAKRKTRKKRGGGQEDLELDENKIAAQNQAESLA